MAGGCKEWCTNYTDSIRDAELYDLETNEWTPVAELPIPLQSAKMELLEGRPTMIGGWDSDAKDFNGVLYQYFVETNEWKKHPHVQMRMPRSSPAVFQVPRCLFHC